MPVPVEWLVLGGGLLIVAITYWYVERDARENDIPRPRLWATVTAGTIAVGVGLYVFVPRAPLTGVLLTANTGPVLYAFEREVVTEDADATDESPLPGERP